MTPTTRPPYEWLFNPSQSRLAEAGCITLLSGAENDSALTQVGFEFDDSDHDESETVYVTQCQGGVLLAELNGFQGARPELITTLSTLGRAASVFWNVNNHTAFSCAAQGKLKTSIAGDRGYSRTLPPRLRTTLVSALTRGHSELGALIVCAGAYTGTSFDESALATAAVGHFTGTPVGLRYQLSQLLQGGRYTPPAMIADIVAADETRQRRLAGFAARITITTTGLATFEHPGLDRVLRAAESGRLNLDMSLITAKRLTYAGAQAATRIMTLHGQTDEYESERHWLSWDWALETLLFLTTNESMTAALGAVEICLRLSSNRDASGISQEMESILKH